MGGIQGHGNTGSPSMGGGMGTGMPGIPSLQWPARCVPPDDPQQCLSMLP